MRSRIKGAAYRGAVVLSLIVGGTATIQTLGVGTAVADVVPPLGCVTEQGQTLCPGDPDYINEPLTVIDLPGVLTVTNATYTVSDNVQPITDVITLPPTTSEVDSSGTVLSVNPMQSGGYELGTGVIDLTKSDVNYACINNNSNKYFYIAKPVVTHDSTDVAQYRWQFNPYTQYYARQVSGTWTWQEEICTIGGADGQNGYRTLYNASVMTDESSDASTRIGLNYGTSSSSSASLTISAALGPVTISGGVPSSGGLYGQYGKPKYKSADDQWSGSESFAGWKAGCTYSRTCGSPNMQSQVHHALFEFFHGDWNQRFPLDAQFDYYCADPFGVGCG